MGIRAESNVEQLLQERWLDDEQALDRLVRSFQGATLGRREWTHRAHLGIASSLILTEGSPAALVCMREAIPRLNDSHGTVNSRVSGYHETLTVFWVRVLTRLLNRLPAKLTRLQKVTVAVEAYGDMRRLDRTAYSYDVLTCEKARVEWCPPDHAPAWLREG